MAITVSQTTVSTSAVLLYTASDYVTIDVGNGNATVTNAVSLGGTSGVTAGNGHMLYGTQHMRLDLPPGGTLYAIRNTAADQIVTVWARS